MNAFQSKEPSLLWHARRRDAASSVAPVSINTCAPCVLASHHRSHQIGGALTLERVLTAADALPEYHHRERHSIAVEAPGVRALSAAREVRLEDMPVIRALMRFRGMRRAPGGSLWETMRASSFRPHGDDTLVAVGQPWRLRGGMRDVDDFAAFAEPGYAKMALDLRFADGRLATETRVFLTSAAARRRFRAYWLLIRPFSGLTRRLWLRAAKRRAEQ